ncbi:amidase signature enzyme [Naviculisporaceae sp. PSN 640]
MASKPFDLLRSTATEIQHLFNDPESNLTSASLLERVLEQIDSHDSAGFCLSAILSRPPRQLLRERARQLDLERLEGRLRSPLHGIPCIVTDSIATHPDLGMITTAGSWALIESKPAKNADVINKLLDAGLLVVGKANLTTPGGSSSGSAVGVAAGFAILSLGVETQGSIVSPASRAALYAIKPTNGLVSMGGVIPVAESLDCVGGMARSPLDLALLTQIILKSPLPPGESFVEAMTGKWDGIRLGFVDETIWQLPEVLCEPNEDALSQMRNEYRKIMAKLGELGVHIEYPVTLPEGKAVSPALGDIMKHEFHKGLNKYLEDLEYSPVRSLAELVAWNKDHADWELPEDHPSQSALEDSLASDISATDNAKNLAMVRELAQQGINEALDAYKLDAIASLADSPLASIASAAGYPIATMPLGIMDLNGRPFGICMIARAGEEKNLFRIMSAWEILVERAPPPALL